LPQQQRITLAVCHYHAAAAPQVTPEIIGAPPAGSIPQPGMPGGPPAEAPVAAPVAPMGAPPGALDIAHLASVVHDLLSRAALGPLGLLDCVAPGPDSLYSVSGGYVFSIRNLSNMHMLIYPAAGLFRHQQETLCVCRLSSCAGSAQPAGHAARAPRVCRRPAANRQRAEHRHVHEQCAGGCWRHHRRPW
jgi:hypothetical protein